MLVSRISRGGRLDCFARAATNPDSSNQGCSRGKPAGLHHPSRLVAQAIRNEDHLRRP